MHQLRRQFGEWPEHEGPAQQVRPRQLQPWRVLYLVTEQQYVEVHGPRRPFRRIARATALRLDAFELALQQRGIPGNRHCGDEVDEFRSFESDGLVAVAAGKARA